MTDFRLTLRLLEGQRAEWQQAAGADMPLSRFVKRVVNEHVRAVLSNAPLAEEVGVGDRRPGAGGSSLGIESTAGSGDAPGGRPSPANGDRFVKDCSNSRNHIDGKTCKWCGGVR